EGDNPGGFTLPTDGSKVTGTFGWFMFYTGDDNNDAAYDQGGLNEQAEVIAASPKLSTTPEPATAVVGQTLQDTADLTGGFNPTGVITFRLYAPGVDPTVGPADFTEVVLVTHGDGTYSTSVGSAATVAGDWHWVAVYDGDSNNKSTSSGPLDEPVTVTTASPPQADLSPTKTGDNSSPSVSDTITFTITLTNHGPNTATDVIVSDPLPAGLLFVSATASQGSFDHTTGIWTVGTVTTTTPQNLI